jgi:hypothetical protein
MIECGEFGAPHGFRRTRFEVFKFKTATRIRDLPLLFASEVRKMVAAKSCELRTRALGQSTPFFRKAHAQTMSRGQHSLQK